MRFYGGTPTSWIDTPMSLVEAYAGALPRLHAEEAMDHSTRVAMGSGSVQPEARRRIMRQWERAAEAGQSRQPMTLEHRKFAAASIGVRVG